ncbi:MAG TPA: condensation domain-containing protein, partial [Thermoanaerobaculia bacterium]|nr:condensation domain-containing protein [Thermoanaerobaculia bacterium]
MKPEETPASAAAEPVSPAANGEKEPSELALWLAGEVARRSGSSTVDPRQPIAGCGLDSLAAVEVLHAIEEKTGVTLPLEMLFSEMSIQEVAAQLPAESPASAPAATPEPAQKPATVGDFPLSQAQLSLWFLHNLTPESPAYNVPNALRILGPLDPARLEGALQALAERHPALRTTFVADLVAQGGEPVQRVAEEAGIRLAVHDAAAWSAAELDRELAEASSRPFDLVQGPLARADLYRRSAEESVLLFSLHHIITDFWSLGVLFDELSALYDGRPLPAPPPPYSEFTRFQAGELEGPAGEVLWEFWAARLAGELPVLDLPTDRPRPPVQRTNGEALRRALVAERTDDVRALAASGATPFMVLLAVFEALLSRYSGQTELLVGTVSAARSRAAFARTAGYFVNPLVLRADLSRAPGMTRLIERVREDALGAFTHQDYPFPLLVKRRQPERDPARSPLFQAMFVLQKAQLGDGQDLTGFALGEPGTRVGLGSLTFEGVPLPQKIAQFDLTLTAGEVGGRFITSFDYNTDLFDEATIARLAGHFERLLAAAAAEPERLIAEL